MSTDVAEQAWPCYEASSTGFAVIGRIFLAWLLVPLMPSGSFSVSPASPFRLQVLNSLFDSRSIYCSIYDQVFKSGWVYIALFQCLLYMVLEPFLLSSCQSGSLSKFAV